VRAGEVGPLTALEATVKWRVGRKVGRTIYAQRPGEEGSVVTTRNDVKLSDQLDELRALVKLTRQQRHLSHRQAGEQIGMAHAESPPTLAS
jgi:hypothetical protein